MSFQNTKQTLCEQKAANTKRPRGRPPSIKRVPDQAHSSLISRSKKKDINNSAEEDKHLSGKSGSINIQKPTPIHAASMQMINQQSIDGRPETPNFFEPGQMRPNIYSRQGLYSHHASTEQEQNALMR